MNINLIEICVFLVTFSVFLYGPVFSELMYYNFCVYGNNKTYNVCKNDDILNKKIIKDMKKFSFYRNMAEFVPLFLSPFIVNFMSTKFSPEKCIIFPILCFLNKQIIGLIFYFYPHLNLYDLVIYIYINFYKHYLDTFICNCCFNGNGKYIKITLFLLSFIYGQKQFVKKSSFIGSCIYVGFIIECFSIWIY